MNKFNFLKLGIGIVFTFTYISLIY